MLAALEKASRWPALLALDRPVDVPADTQRISDGVVRKVLNVPPFLSPPQVHLQSRPD